MTTIIQTQYFGPLLLYFLTVIGAILRSEMHRYPYSRLEKIALFNIISIGLLLAIALYPLYPPQTEWLHPIGEYTIWITSVSYWIFFSSTGFFAFLISFGKATPKSETTKQGFQPPVIPMNQN